jgi:hypothetical protein
MGMSEKVVGQDIDRYLNCEMKILHACALPHDGCEVFEVGREPDKSLCIVLGTLLKEHMVLALLETRASAIARAIANPSRVLVPRPSSSMMALQCVSTI